MHIFSSHTLKLGVGGLLLGLCLMIAGCTKGPSGLGSAESLAAQVPKGVYAAAIFDLKGHVDWVGWARDIDQLLKVGPRGKDFQEEVGMTPEEWVKLFNGSGYLAVLSTASPETPGVISCFGLADGAGFENWWKKQAESYPDKGEEKTIEGIPFRVFDGEAFVGHDAQWLYLAASEADAKTLIQAVAKKGEGLDKNPQFIDGLKQVGTKTSGSVWFADIKGLVAKAEEFDPPYTDATTFTELGALEYAIFAANLESKNFDGFLKVSGESQLAKQLLTKGQIKGESLKALSGSVTSSNTLDAEWTVNTLIKLGMVMTESRQYAGMASLGLMAQGNPWAAFQGEFTGAGNLWEVSVPMLTKNFGSARSQGQMVACKSNLKNIGTALEMYSTDWSGRYPETAAMLTPNYLKTIPDCPAAGKDTYSETLKVTASPDTYSFHCAGHHHSMLQADHPKYNSQEGLISGPESAQAAEEAPPDPSHAIAVVLEEAETAKGFLDKLVPLSGELPKEGESAEFPLPMPDTILEISRKGTPMLKLAIGPQGKSLIAFDGPSLAENEMLSKLLKASPEGLIYLDYMNLGPAYDQVLKAVEGADADAEAKAALEFAKKMKARAGSLEGASSVTVTAEGLRYRSNGVVNGGLVMVGGIGGAIMVPNFIRARSQGQTTACKSNLKNIGTALEMYSTDWSGAYPEDTTKLVPNYLRTMPECPMAGTDTYSESYSRIKTKEGWDSYQFFCKGENHTAVSLPANYPAYNGIIGLQERP